MQCITAETRSNRRQNWASAFRRACVLAVLAFLASLSAVNAVVGYCPPDVPTLSRDVCPLRPGQLLLARV